jgi:hypothetical protein
MFDGLARDDFDKAYRKAFFRKLTAFLNRNSNELLEYDEVRRQLPFQGQHDMGMQTIPLDKIVGSVGRYRDFDRAFLPIQRQTSDRWISISRARYEDKELPAIDVYKIGDVYFVRDGNHRVSVAREREQLYIDAYVTEIDIPIALTPDMDLQAVIEKKDYAEFMKQTNLLRLRPDADVELSLKMEYGRLLSHIDTHRYYMSMERGYEVPYEEAVASWYDNTYLPLVHTIREQGLLRDLPNYTSADLYLIVSEYQWLLRHEEGEEAIDAVAAKLSEIYVEKEVSEILRYMRRRNWISQTILDQEHQSFLETTNLGAVRPGQDVLLSFPGKYRNLLRHISFHQYYMALNQQRDVPYEEAVASFFSTIYEPLKELLHDPDLIAEFPRRTEDDLVLWVMDHRQDLVQALDNLPGPPADEA